MIQLKNFLIKREQSQARLSFAKREKSRLLAKTILTLVALLAVTTGAWADETLLLTIESQYYSSFKSGSMTFDDKVTVTFSNSADNDSNFGWYATSPASLLTVTGTNGYTITSCKFYTGYGPASTGYTIKGESPSVYLSEGYAFTDANQSENIGAIGIKKIEVYGGVASSSTGPEVAWNKAEKTGKFTMPGGNVTLEPEYYPQATVADGGVTAADADARATTDDPLVKVDATKLTGAKKLMYFVSNSGTTAPAYDAEGWTDQLPTAEGFTQQGMVYVWYYPVGIDEGVGGATATYSDGDICLQSITARIAAAPTYAVEFAEGTAEPTLWKAEPATGVTKDQTVTVTYTGSKKVIGVKAETKAKAPAGPITVTWNGADITGTGGGKSFTKDGVTITADDIEFMDKNFIGGGTFTTTLGNFTKIEVTTDGWYASGTGWSGSTWTGNASSVSFSGEIMGYGGDNLKFVFTIEPTN